MNEINPAYVKELQQKASNALEIFSKMDSAWAAKGKEIVLEIFIQCDFLKAKLEGLDPEMQKTVLKTFAPFLSKSVSALEIYANILRLFQ